MWQKLKPGGMLNFVTPDEVAALIDRPRQVTRMRVAATIGLSAAGGTVPTGGDVYKIPAGYEFEVRRVVLVLTGNAPTDPNTGNVLLNAAGKWVAYLRSGSLIEYAQPNYGTAIQVPGVQTWGDQQGPYLRNAEVFGVACLGLTANSDLNVYLEGLLVRPDMRRES